MKNEKIFLTVKDKKLQSYGSYKVTEIRIEFLILTL